MMKRTFPSIALGFLLATSARAEEVTFKPGSEYTDYFMEANRKTMMSIQDGSDSSGLLNFHSEGGGTVLTLVSGGKEVISAAEEVEIEFRTEGTTTLGIFLRGQGEGGDAYMAFISASAEKTLMLYLCKTKQTSTQQPAQSALVSKHIQTYIPGDWYKLKLSLKDGVGKVTFSGELTQAGGSQNLLEISAEDSENPITQPGAFLLRLNGDKAKGGGTIQFKSINITP